MQEGTTHAVPRRSLLYSVTSEIQHPLRLLLDELLLKSKQGCCHPHAPWEGKVLLSVCPLTPPRTSDTLQRWKANIMWPPPDWVQCRLHPIKYNGEWRAIRSHPGWAPCLSPVTLANQLLYNTLFCWLGWPLPHVCTTYGHMVRLGRFLEECPAYAYSICYLIAVQGKEQGHQCGACLWVSLRRIRILGMFS